MSPVNRDTGNPPGRFLNDRIAILSQLSLAQRNDKAVGRHKSLHTGRTRWIRLGATAGNEMLKAIGRYRGGLVVLLLLAATYLFVACGGGGGSGTAGPAPTPHPPGPGATFPLHTEAGKRYLIDAQGNPFLIHGDTAWSLIVQLTDAEVDQYLDDRKAKGFNTVLVNLIERYFSNSAPNDRLGNAPFAAPGDFSAPNNAYFARAASIVQKAADRNMLVLMTPAYLGFDSATDNEGWFPEMQASGTTTLFAYGEYLANRFAIYDNIIWLNGGDRTPSSADRIYHNAVADGIRNVRTTWLHSFHGAPGDAALVAVGAPTPSWLAVNSIYSQANDVHARGLVQYNNSTMPYFLLEARYESEPGPPDPVVTTQQLRAQAYEALLAGATGQIFGNNPIWHFQAPTSLFPYTGTWQTALNSGGSVSMQRLAALWTARSWWLLQPQDSMITAGHAARASDGSFALAYVTTNVTVQLNQLAGPNVLARWYDPFTGVYNPINTFPKSASPFFTTPGNNGNNGADWVLVLESQ